MRNVVELMSYSLINLLKNTFTLCSWLLCMFESVVTQISLYIMWCKYFLFEMRCGGMD